MDQSHGMRVRDPYGDPGEVACCPLAQWQNKMAHPVPSLLCVPLTTAQWMLVPFLVAQALLAVPDVIGIGASVSKGKLRQSILYVEVSEDSICGQERRAREESSIPRLESQLYGFPAASVALSVKWGLTVGSAEERQG